MPNFLKLADGLDVDPVLRRLKARPELWDDITIRQEFPGTCHADTKTIYLRAPSQFTIEGYQESLDSVDYWILSELAPDVVHLMRHALLDVVKAKEIGRVMIVSLKPGGKVLTHIDEGKYAEHFTRFHLCLTGSPDATMTVGGETMSFQPGEVWSFNHRVEHSACNLGTDARIHIIFDAVPQNAIHFS
jgi:hypothetical protein